MRSSLSNSWRRWFVSWPAVACAISFLGMDHAGATVDLNGNGISDVWEWTHNAVGISPADDPDGDGFSNLLEAIAATNPFDSNSYPRIALASYSATNLSVNLACALGKQYQLLSAANIPSTNWIVETNVVARSGTNVTLSIPLPGTVMFYRVSISDIDSDGDGLNDWEEYQLGLDPFNPFSNGHQDTNGNPIGDYAYATGMLSRQNVITMTATVPAATEPIRARNRPLWASLPLRAADFR